MKPIEYQPIVDEFVRAQRERPLVFRSPRRRKQSQRTISDLQNLHLTDTAGLEAEWTDRNGSSGAGDGRVGIGEWERGADGRGGAAPGCRFDLKNREKYKKALSAN